MSHVESIVLEKKNSLILDFTLVLLSSILIGLFGQIAIPLPFTPVPIATQSHVVLLLASFLGSKRAVLATILFLAQGAFGLPVFAGGMGGAAWLLGPTGGYLIGYVAAAFVTGYLVQQMKNRTSWKIFSAMAAGNAIIFLFGASYLSKFVGVEKAFLLGVAPFLLGDFLKLMFCSKLRESF